MIYADFESILVPKNNGKQKPDESYTKTRLSHHSSIKQNNKFFVSYIFNNMFIDSFSCFIFFTIYISFDFNSANSSFIFPLDSSFISPISFILERS